MPPSSGVRRLLYFQLVLLHLLFLLLSLRSHFLAFILYFFFYIYFSFFIFWWQTFNGFFRKLHFLLWHSLVFLFSCYFAVREAVGGKVAGWGWGFWGLELELELLPLLLMTMAAILDFECISAFCRSEQNFCSPCWLSLSLLPILFLVLVLVLWEIFSTDWQLCKWAATRTKEACCKFVYLHPVCLLLLSLSLFVFGWELDAACIKTLFHFLLFFPFCFCFCLMKKSKLLRKSFYASFAILANGYPSATLQLLPSIILWCCRCHCYLCYLLYMKVGQIHTPVYIQTQLAIGGKFNQTFLPACRWWK